MTACPRGVIAGLSGGSRQISLYKNGLFVFTRLGMVYAPKMIVVSNRLPFVLKETAGGKLERIASAGGLVTAVAPVVVEGKGLWVGWPGNLYQPGTPIPESSPDDKTPTAGLKSENIVPVLLDADLYAGYYNGCCNATFWPLFHLMAERAVFSLEFWKAYQKANDVFALKAIEALERLLKGGEEKLSGNPPIVWLHDYHLMTAANTIRENPLVKKLKFKLGFFLHIPFPPWDILRIFPWADEVLLGLLGNDLVGFHTHDYCFNFIECCRRSLGLRVDSSQMTIEHGGRTIRVCPLPIGIPFQRFEALAKEAPSSELKEPGVKLILGIDRLDYTKGIQKRLLGFERLLENWPEFIEKVVLLQVAVPSRTDVKEYQALKEEMDQLVGRINGRFSTPKWSPIRYIYGTLPQNELAGFYRDSDVALITPLRDGMNLVAKEFVACQVNNPGVLIISPFAGAAEAMQEALICNPYETDDVSDTLYRALTMPEDERILRNNYLRQRERATDVHFWMKSFLKVMGEIISTEGEQIQPTQFKPMSFDDFDQFLSKFFTEKKQLALLLDFDGTLAPLVRRPELAELPKEAKYILEKLAKNPDIHISIVSGRAVEDVKNKVGIEGITYAGNHGLEILQSDQSHFVHPMPAEYQEKAKKLLKDLQEQVCKEGAWVENKGVTMTFHYRETPVEWRAELVGKARELMELHGFRANHAHAALEARPPIDWHKGRASIYILRTAFGLDWAKRINIIYVGDDTTDEDAMRSLKGMAISFRVTEGRSVKTVADHRLPSTDCVVTLLKWVDENFSPQ